MQGREGQRRKIISYQALYDQNQDLKSRYRSLFNQPAEFLKFNGYCQGTPDVLYGQYPLAGAGKLPCASPPRYSSFSRYLGKTSTF